MNPITNIPPAAVHRWNDANLIAKAIMAKGELDEEQQMCDAISQQRQAWAKPLAKLMLGFIVAGLVLLSALTCFAAGERELVAVVAARVRAAKQANPDVPDEPPAIDNRLLNGSVSAEAAIPSPTRDELESIAKERDQATARAVELEAALNRSLLQINDLKKPPQKSGHPSQDDAPQDAVGGGHSLFQMTLTSPVGDSAAAVQPHLVIVATASWCGPCHSQEMRNGHGNGRVRCIYVDVEKPRPPEVPERWWGSILRSVGGGIPLTTWLDGRGVVSGVVNSAITNDQIADMIEDDRFPPTRGASSVAPTAMGGSVRTGGMVRHMLNQFGSQLGVGESVTLRIDKSGRQQIDLMKSQAWTVEMVCGKFGHVEVSTTSKRPPVQQLGITYRTLSNGQFSLDFDPLVVTLPNKSPQATGASGTQAYGIDPITIGWTIYSVGSAIYEILNPHADLSIPGTMEFTAKLESADKLVITFKDTPGIHVSAWFQFNLQVQRVEITPTNARIVFLPQPQNWIRIDSRDVAINDK